MKKILIIFICMIMIFCFGACLDSEEKQEQPQKVYGIGETQKWKGVSVTVTNVESGLYCGGEKSDNGSWVKIYFTMINENSEPCKIFYTSFTLNDTYTVRETTYRLTNIESGGFSLIKGNIYDFYIVFDCKYAHYEAEMVFEWEKSWLDGTLKWEI